MAERAAAASPRGERTQKAILKAARELLGESGVQGMSMSRLEQQSGAKLGSIYFHFGSKDGVIAAAIRQAAEDWMSGDPPWEDLAGPPIERLKQVLELTADRFESHPDFLRAFLTLALSPHDALADREIRAIRDAVVRNVGEYLSKAFATAPDADRLSRRLTPFVIAWLDGAFVAKDLDPDLDLHVLFSDLYAALVAIFQAELP